MRQMQPMTSMAPSPAHLSQPAASAMAGTSVAPALASDRAAPAEAPGHVPAFSAPPSNAQLSANSAVDDDGVAALLLGFGAAPRTQAPLGPRQMSQTGLSGAAQLLMYGRVGADDSATGKSVSVAGADTSNGAAGSDGAGDSRSGHGREEYVDEDEGNEDEGEDEDDEDDEEDGYENARQRRHAGRDDDGGDDDDDDDGDDDEDGQDDLDAASARVRSGSQSDVAARHKAALARARARDAQESGDDEEGRGEDDDVIDLRGMSAKSVEGARLQVSYMERQGKSLAPMAYRGSVVSLDPRKGLRVKLDGYVRREWVTDEDEWVWLPEHDSAPLPHQLELMRTMAEQPAAAGKAAKKEKSAPVKDKVATPAEKAATTPPVTKPTEKAFEGASLVRLRLRGAPIVELPKSLTDKPRRSSAVRPLPHTHLGAATAAAYEEREKIAQTRPPKVEAKSAVPPSPKELPKRERSTSDAASGSAEGTAAEGGASSAGRGTKASAKAKASAVVSAAGGKGSSGGGDGDDDESGGGGEGSAGKVTIANGPHSGKEAKVLHVGNGWVKLQLPSGSIVHMRKWDLHGDIPLKMRSPTKQPKQPATFDAESQQQQPQKMEREEEPAPEPAASSSSRSRSSHKSEAAAATSDGASANGASANGIGGGSKQAAASVSDGGSASEAPKKAKKRPPEALQDGFELGAQVWARWSGIKFSHGVISKLLTSSKWVLVTFDNDTSQWVTSRELVLDEQPAASALEEGTEVIAAWEDDENFYKGRILHMQSAGKYRVRYDDWDDALVLLEGLRILPDGFGKK